MPKATECSCCHQGSPCSCCPLHRHLEGSLQRWKEEQQHAIVRLAIALMNAGLVKSREDNCIEVACRAAKEVATLRQIAKLADEYQAPTEPEWKERAKGPDSKVRCRNRLAVALMRWKRTFHVEQG